LTVWRAQLGSGRYLGIVKEEYALVDTTTSVFTQFLFIQEEAYELDSFLNDLLEVLVIGGSENWILSSNC